MALTYDQKQKIKEYKAKLEVENAEKKSITHKKILAGELCMKCAKVNVIDDDFLELLESYLKLNEKKGNWFSSWFGKDNKKKND